MVLSNILDIDPPTLRGDFAQASNLMRCCTDEWHIIHSYCRHLHLLYQIPFTCPFQSGHCRYTCTIHRSLHGRLQRKELPAAKSPDEEIIALHLHPLPTKADSKICIFHFKRKQFLTLFRHNLFFYSETLLSTGYSYRSRTFLPSEAAHQQ